jgi:Rieske Fe-S protein
MSSCTGCTRRALLRGLAIGTAGTLIGCGGGGTTPDVDATTQLPPDGGPGSITMCGANLCIDISQTPALQNTDGTLVVTVTAPVRDHIMIYRQAEGMYVTVTDICTHTGCGVNYKPSLGHFRCPCHGSEFALSGDVIRGPAARPLKTYANTFDAGTQTLTITLA